MNSCLILTGAFIVQEIVSVNAALLNAYRSGCDVNVIHVLYILTTLLDLLIGYALGHWSKRAVRNARFIKFFDRMTQHIEAYFGENGRRFTLIFMGFVLYVYIGTFIAAWLELPLLESVAFIFIGDILWYGMEWATVLGVNALTPNPIFAFGAILAVSLVIVVVLDRWSKKTIRKPRV